jgi:cytochrome c oxidase assembly protein subunit 15
VAIHGHPLAAYNEPMPGTRGVRSALGAPRWIRRLALAGLLLCFVVVVLGAYVRLNAAGLGCPDWPGCYGHVTPLGAANATAQAAFPSRPLDVGKAWKEMIHRYAASTLGFIIVVITAIAIAYREKRLLSPTYAIALLATVVVQGILGMLTVTWQLKPLIVTLHLIFGMTTLGLLWWLLLSLRRESWGATHGAARGFGGGDMGSAARGVRIAHALAVVGFVALAVQIVLGGWTSSNYAAVACPDFPTCQNSWWPHSDYRNAFILWRGLGINYEGGILDNPARVAIHLTHRLGALVATLALTCGSLFVVIRKPAPSATPAAVAVLAALALQLAIGISMVLKAFPLELTTTHTAGAALLLLATLTLVRRTRSSGGY